ncbi:2-oxoglutarate dehydrogenase E1 component [Tenacibaculum finnmarkense genomovar finnmarkense]|nr:2-oxoglutarate dehydrogenase E1 component [Tenacibaculum finnmarkense genomovar finnmarkense]MCD8412321.1 2-oxoglutarate dehydrogenase E1 component [Tenacibaculum finnmarkense genomovar ulcerans]MCG8713186.1 2-oxoglutarate dehydrogenase E1 component [Tenacibaculum finnmarkense]MBE7692860.1 2-oxoglutarate dehydrogenase E1 component [Tenacibaculum finnmarkense genomovar finnmarkense]MCD8403165.1 2-oxoglutarate dehydrogenase E1 component [Tenacibaculum finnmarkense genomovar finnmarkense]
MDKFSFLNAAHTGFISDLYEQYQKNPDRVEPSWRSFFQGYDLANEDYSLTDQEVSVEVPDSVRKEFLVIDLINGYRTRGHLFTKTNPVRDRRKYTPSLDIETFGLNKTDLATVFNAGDILGIGSTTLTEIIKHLKAIFCESIGVEYMYLRNPDELNWWQTRLNKNDNQSNYDVEAKKYILTKLNQASTFESFLQTKYVGQKRFSVEGGETLIPGVSVALRDAAEKYGVEECVLGMAHRGRLNTLVNIFKKPVRDLFSEFEGKDFEDQDIDGDVKYHLGLTLSKAYKGGQKMKMNLVPNPSHLETVAAVAEGIVRAKVDLDYKGDNSKILPIIVHGDAAIAGQGIVYEMAQMMTLNGYKTGGTIHVVVNNQVGFTTNYLDARSSTYCTDVAKVTLSPVLHVNADDAEAVCHAMEMAVEYRMKFKKDIYIDLLGYRKYGHNEGDEPRFTQPDLYKAISKHKNAKEIYAEKLISEGSISADYVKEITDEFKAHLEVEFTESKKKTTSKIQEFMPEVWDGFVRKQLQDMLQSTDTTYSVEALKDIAEVISTTPQGHKFVRKAERILQGRKKMVFEENLLDWGTAENLAYGTLLEEGFNIRISGEDVERGTFSHRHAIMRDEETLERVNLLNTNTKNKGEMTIYNSHLSEYGVLGFDYGYAMAAPNTLTIWEAQFGDFANGAQIVFDQYVCSAESKWKLQNGLVMLLPHGYEGQGPEHSSGRMERFLQSSATDNWTIANCSTPANMYHILRRQMKREFRKPLVVFTPKSLLRLPKAVNTIEDLAHGSFQEVIDDTIDTSKVKKMVFCTGKFYYDLLAEREQLAREDVALVRIEQLFPLHNEQIKTIMDKYPNVERYVWAQEEPKNMGSWSYMLERFELARLECASRGYHSAPAAGSSARYKRRHQEVLDKVFD